jgi:Protein kinase domain
MTFSKISIEQFHSSCNTTKSIGKKYPMSQPLILKEWATFKNEVLNCMENIPNVDLAETFHQDSSESCSGENSVQATGDFSLFKPLRILIKSLCPHFDYLNEGRFTDIEGRKILCDPDRVWVTKGYTTPKISIEYKTPWALNPSNIIEEYQKESSRFQSGSLKEKGKVMRAVEQIYIYMSINRHRYGCLTNFDKTWFLKKVEDDSNTSQSVVLISPPVACDSKEPYTLTSAWLYILLHIEKGTDWLYASPVSSQVSSPIFTRKRKRASNDKYSFIQLDKIIHWKEIIGRSQAGAVAIGSFKNEEDVVFKTIDISKRNDGMEQFDHEVAMYKVLQRLQGLHIPRLLAYGSLGGLLIVIVFENVGRCITKEEAAEREVEINEVLGEIHKKGIMHNDLRLPNIMVDKEGKIRIIDFGMATKEDDAYSEKFDLESSMD